MDTTTTVTAQKTVKACDFCGETYNVRQCPQCHRDVCESHFEHNADIYEGWGHICVQCARLRDIYQPQIAASRRIERQAVDDQQARRCELEGQWKAASLRLAKPNP